MFRGLVRDSPAFPAAAQRAALIQAGVPERAIYDNFDNAKRSLRGGNRLVVAGYQALGEDRAAITEAIQLVHKWKPGCAVMDAASKRLSSNKSQCEAAIADALRDLANARRGPRGIPKGRMPWDQIQKHWAEKSRRTVDVMATINHGRRGRARISYATIYRKLGKRDVVTGRPSKEK